MSASPTPGGGRAIAVERVGLVTPVGLTAEGSCAAFRARMAAPSDLGLRGADGRRLLGHRVPLPATPEPLERLAQMLQPAVEEALAGVPRAAWAQWPLLLCVAEKDRPGRIAGLDDELLRRLEQGLGVSFAAGSGTVAFGRVGVAAALRRARALLEDGTLPGVVVAAADSLLTEAAAARFGLEDRLLTRRNSNGFMLGEGAGALRLVRDDGRAGVCLCTGLGFAVEPAPLGSEQPLRAEGLTQAVRQALADAGQEIHALDFRVTDNAGEQYYFKESALALSRTMRQRKAEFDLWHPAECVGEAGAASGVIVIAAAEAACRKAYAPGPRVLAHWANDAGERAALVMEYRELR